jgi:hypothetical protein
LKEKSLFQTKQFCALAPLRMRVNSINQLQTGRIDGADKAVTWIAG